ncbi:MAG: hypothetical protein Q8K62_12300 [Thiobacillus sp.]|nr:hypothetical protein [Thiobacillus sp.]
MGMAIQFDTLRYVETLESAGIPRSQAKAYAEVLATALGQDASWAPTIKDGIVDIKSGLADIKSDLKLMKWMLVPVAAGVLSLVMKAFT